MLLRRFYDEPLAQASYLVGCSESGEALIVDPNRDVERYMVAVAAAGLRVSHVAETHVHADFASGAKELAERTGATLHLSDAGEPPWKYGYAGSAKADLLRDGDSFAVGRIRIDVEHTPGHTPEHLSFLVTDTSTADRPMGAFTGDFLFVGDVGRPDLLERAVNIEGTMRESARALFDSLQRFKRYPDYLQIWPGHGAGSACGKALGAVPQSTLGYERLFNWALTAGDREEFVEQVLAGQPDPPRYFAVMKQLNRDGPPTVGGPPMPPSLSAARLAPLVEARATLVDLRSAAEFAAGHLPGAINIPLDRSFLTWAGWLVPYDLDIYLIAGDTGWAERAARQLALIGLDRVKGIFTAGSIVEWAATSGPFQTVPQMAVGELAARLAREPRSVAVIDVRASDEWEAGHLPGVRNIPLGRLPERLGELPSGTTVVTQCQSGARSSIAASLLQAHGMTNVVNLRGGFVEWARSRHPVVREKPAASAP